MAESAPHVSLDDRSDDVLIWSRPAARRIDGSWVSGADALRNVPSADELKDFWTPPPEERAASLVAEAEAALGLPLANI